MAKNYQIIAISFNHNIVCENIVCDAGLTEPFILSNIKCLEILHIFKKWFSAKKNKRKLFQENEKNLIFCMKITNSKKLAEDDDNCFKGKKKKSSRNDIKNLTHNLPQTEKRAKSRKISHNTQTRL